MVRRAVLNDLAFIEAELRKFATFYGTKLSLFPKDSVIARAVITDLIEKHFFLMGEISGNPAGFIVGWVSPHPFNPDIRMLTEALWWVAPQYRRTKVGRDLLDEYIKWGKENVDWVSMTIEWNSPVKAETFIRRGFKYRERSFLLETSQGGMPSPP